MLTRENFKDFILNLKKEEKKEILECTEEYSYITIELLTDNKIVLEGIKG